MELHVYWWFSASLQYHRSVRDEKITVDLHFAIYLMLQASYETNVVIAKASVYIYIEHGYLQKDKFVFI